ncbi:hypothetical protein J8A01_02405 [Vibrio parahaemolyticus]|uniref:hypothetical protein n=1 Tax=Vibrio parahaemolyticus TaxID=670 RepID=UPI001375AE7E|nr:hypothetical protein [Vibrio parahaemolyticus]EHK9576265.1 hypothetical protein [Vibrio parahaemolyticus]EHK9580357.1 hypothetical protein [Vibrio parahaemolyticus]EIZ1898916.1 hypothetical protein [Vibrio parahaemolyticus]EKO5156077.1 hypothetical protein [Vibrio parahaemolyticus]ELB2089684.1 hypothetical protein [Vibrio parahaemolyticus]
MMPALKTILLCLGTIGLSACSAKAELQTSQAAEHQAILVEGYRTSGTTISFVAESTGCSQNEDFSLKIEQISQAEALLTIVRDKADHCKRMPFPKTFTLPLDKELQGKKLSITNPKSKSLTK